MNTIRSLLGYTDTTPNTFDPSEIENICFKGGGMKGNSFLGVDRALTELGVWPQIKRIIGSSAGAIFAGAAACRVPYSELAEVIKSTDYTLFKDTTWGYAGEGYSLIEYLGIYKGDYFYNWYGNLLEKYVGDADITFQQVHDKFGVELIITVTDLTKKKLVYLCRYNNASMPIREAVRRSMSIPIFYVPVSVKEEDGIVHMYVDGGCSNNFPLEYFDQFYPNRQMAFSKTIGFNLTNDDEAVDPSKYIDQTAEISNVIDLTTVLINTLIEEIERLRVEPDDYKRTVSINTFGVKATDFDISRKTIEKLEDSGYTATMSFFGKHENNKVEKNITNI